MWPPSWLQSSAHRVCLQGQIWMLHMSECCINLKLVLQSMSVNLVTWPSIKVSPLWGKGSAMQGFLSQTSHPASKKNHILMVLIWKHVLFFQKLSTQIMNTYECGSVFCPVTVKNKHEEQKDDRKRCFWLISSLKATLKKFLNNVHLLYFSSGDYLIRLMGLVNGPWPMYPVITVRRWRRCVTEIRKRWTLVSRFSTICPLLHMKPSGRVCTDGAVLINRTHTLHHCFHLF